LSVSVLSFLFRLTFGELLHSFIWENFDIIEQVAFLTLYIYDMDPIKLEKFLLRSQ